MNTPGPGPDSLSTGGVDVALGLALRTTGVPVALVDADLVPVWANDAFGRRLGYTGEVLRARHRPLPAEPRFRFADPDAAAGAIAARTEFTLRARLRTGARVWVSTLVHAMPSTDADGRPVWVVLLGDLVGGPRSGPRSTGLSGTDRADLQLIAQVSELVMQVDGIADLDPVAAVLRRSVVSDALFLAVPARGRAPAASPDPVLAALDGGRDGLVALDLAREHPAGSVSRQVVEQYRAVRMTTADAAEPSDPVWVLSVPGRDRPFGLLVVAPSTPGSPPDDRELTLLRLTARRAGLALENAELFGREHRLATAMQRALLPHQADVDGLDVWTYYAPTMHSAQVGGDWYDVMALADRVAVAVGDVVGHDVEAAVTMGQLRSVVRAYAFDLVDPAEVVGRVDQLVDGLTVSRAAGLVYATLTPVPDGWRVDYVRAGHLPALLLHDGTASWLDGGLGPMVGFGADATRVTASATLSPGDTLVLYTDGLVERRERDLRTGMAELASAAVAATAPDSAGIGEDLLARLGRDAEDDIAVVVVRVPVAAGSGPAGPGPRRRRWSLPPRPSSLRLARRAVQRTCVAWDLAEVVPSAELVVSELVANAITHGWGDVSLQLYDTADGLRIEVRDANPEPPVVGDGHPGRIGGYGMKIVEQLGDWGWRQAAGGGKVVWAKLRPGTGQP